MSQENNPQTIQQDANSLSQDLQVTDVTHVDNTANVDIPKDDAAPLQDDATSNVVEETKKEEVSNDVVDVETPQVTLSELNNQAIEYVDAILYANWFTEEQIKTMEAEIIAERQKWWTESNVVEVQDNPERVEIVKENAMLKVRNTDLQAQNEEAQNIIASQWKTIQELKNKATVLSDVEREFVDKMRLSQEHKDNAYYQANYERMLKSELEARWWISLDGIEHQAYLRKSNNVSNQPKPIDQRALLVEQQRKAEIQKAMARVRNL